MTPSSNEPYFQSMKSLDRTREIHVYPSKAIADKYQGTYEAYGWRRVSVLGQHLAFESPPKAPPPFNRGNST